MIYVDMDGVVADFDAAVHAEFGQPYVSGGPVDEAFWREECVLGKEIFRKMPPIREGLEMVGALRAAGATVCFMTSTGGMPHHIDVAKQKLDWLRANGVGDCPVAFCMGTQEKGLFARAGHILIDDRPKVCMAWTDNGGVALQFSREAAPAIVRHCLGRLA